MLAIITNLLTNIPPSPHPHSYPHKKIFQIPWYWNIQEKVGDKPKKSHLEERAQTKPEDKCPPSPPKSIKL